MIGITHDFGSSGGAGSGDDFPPLPGQTAYTAADYGCEDFDEVSEKSSKSLGPVCIQSWAKKWFLGSVNFVCLFCLNSSENLAA